MGELSALTAAFLWALASLLFARAGRRTGPVPLNLVKTGFGFLMTAVTVLASSGELWPSVLSGRDWGWLALSGVLGLTIGDSAFFAAINRLGPRRAMLLFALVPPVTAGLAWPVLGEMPGPMALIGALVTLSGVAWVLREKSAAGGTGGGLGWGLLFGGVAVACQSVGSVTAKLAGDDLDSATLSVIRLGFGTLGLLVQTALQRELGDVVRLVRWPREFLVVLVATFLGTYLGLWLSMAALQLTLVGVAATLTATSPIFVLPLSAIFTRERLSTRAVAGAVVAVVGVAVLFLRGG